MAIKFYTINDKILNMRKEKNCLISTILNESVKWSPNLDEQIILCSVLNLLQKHNLPVKKSEVRKAFMKYYNFKFHGGSTSYLNWIYENFNIGKKYTPANQSSFSKGEKGKESCGIGITQISDKSKGKALQSNGRQENE